MVRALSGIEGWGVGPTCCFEQQQEARGENAARGSAHHAHRTGLPFNGCIAERLLWFWDKTVVLMSPYKEGRVGAAGSIAYSRIYNIGFTAAMARR